MSFSAILIAFAILSALTIGLVIWVGSAHQKRKLIDEAQAKLAMYCKAAGIMPSGASIARSAITNMVEFGKANAGMIGTIQANAPGILLLIAKNMNISVNDVMTRARSLQLSADDVLNAIANISAVQLDLAAKYAEKAAQVMPEADLPRELTEAEQEQVIGGMTPEADQILKQAAAGNGVEVQPSVVPFEPISVNFEPVPPAFANDHMAVPYKPANEEVPAGMKVIYLNKSTRKFASRAFAAANPDLVEKRTVRTKS